MCGSLSRGAYRSKASRVYVLHVLHQDELSLPFEGAHRFVGAEGETPLEAAADEMRTAYLEQMQRFQRECRAACDAAHVQYLLAPTHVSPAETLTRLLTGDARTAWA